MADGYLNNIAVTDIACAVPVHKVDNEDFLDYYEEKYIKRFYRTTGIKTRYWANAKQTAADFCYVAAEKIMEKRGISGKDISALVFLTQTPDYKTPSTAFVLQHRLGLGQDAVVFDINMGCTALLHGIYVMAGILQNEGAKYGLVMMGDSLPGRKITEDHTDSMMFGDAGGVLLLEKTEGQIPYALKSDGAGFQTIMNPHGERFPMNIENPDWRICKYYMDGGDVFNFAVNTIPDEITRFIDLFKRKKEDFDYFVFHQANRFILRHLANELEIPFEKVPLSLDSYGNTNGASVLVTLVDMFEKGFFEEKKNILVCAFGIGLSWGVMEFSLDKTHFLPMIYTDDYYAEGQNIKYLKREE